MSVPLKALHPDEKVKAGKLGSTLSKAGLGIAVVFLGLSVVLTMMGSTFINAQQIDYEQFRQETLSIVRYVKDHSQPKAA